MSKENKATELEYFEWFRHNADFGPAHDDVIRWMDNRFTQQTGKNLPTGWEPEKEE